MFVSSQSMDEIVFFWKEGFPLPLYFKKKNSSSTAFSARPPHREEGLKATSHQTLSDSAGTP
jgi:hypothetical protein